MLSFLLLLLLLPLTAQPQTLEFTVEVENVESEQAESRGIYNFSIKTNSNTINLPGSYPLDRRELPAKEDTGSSGYGNSDQPYDDKPHKPGSGWWEYIVSIVESVYWRPLYATRNVIGYSLLVTPKDSSIDGFSLSWIPLTVTLVVGWLESTHWNKESPLFNQIQEQEENRRSQLQIITVPLGTSESRSESHGQEAPSQPVVATRASDLPFSIANILRKSGNNGGDRPPSGSCHTYSKAYCPICNGPCQKRLFAIVYELDLVHSHTRVHCNPASDGSIACRVNDHTQTAGKKPDSYLVCSSNETSTVAKGSASTTGQSSNPPSAKKQRSTGFKKYSCRHPGCDHSFSSPALKSYHIRRDHTDKQTCNVMVPGEDGLPRPCGKVYKNALALRVHKSRYHTGQRTCDETVVGEDGLPRSCGEVFEHALALVNHIKRDHTDKQTCNVIVLGEDGLPRPCGKVYKHVLALRVHKSQYHTGQRTCDVTVVGEDGLPRSCGEVFEHARALKHHKEKHRK